MIKIKTYSFNSKLNKEGKNNNNKYYKNNKETSNKNKDKLIKIIMRIFWI